MSETLWGVVIGGAIAVIGSAVTQLLLFALDNRQKSKEQRMQTLKYLAKSEIAAMLHEGADATVTNERIRVWAEQVGTHSDAQIAANLGAAEAYGEYLEAQRNR